MNSMNYIGKFISNFRDFYNEINTATLTGAIDVVVVEQADGTFNCSPFHVRFGKLGVLRSREKVVDIEINGEPLELQMKLGESGEAFFVEEVPLDELGDEGYIPSHLACSPIPSETFLSRYHDEAEWRSQNAKDLDALHRPKWPQVEARKSVSCPENRLMVTTRPSLPVEEISLLVSAGAGGDAESREDGGGDCGRNFVDEDVTGDFIGGSGDNGQTTVKTFRAETMEGKVSEKVRRISIVTGEFRPISLEPQEAEEIVESADVAKEKFVPIPSDQEDAWLGLDATCREQTAEAAIEEVKAPTGGKKKRRKKSLMKKKAGAKKNGAAWNGQAEVAQVAESEPSLAPVSCNLPASPCMPALVSEAAKKQCGDTVENMFVIDDLEDEPDAADALAHVPAQAIGKEEQAGAEVPTLPLVKSSNDEELASMKHANTAINYHFFSDTEVTPGSSPLDSRPNSPIQSDTEAERQRHADEFVGAKECGELPQSWRWGELPTPATPRTSRQVSSSGLVLDKDKIDGEEDPNAAAEAAQRSIISDMFSFMKKTKRMRHNPEAEGIYLADIKTADLDPEVAAIYFPTNYRQGINLQGDSSREEDGESGNGTSLPQSPHSVEGSIGGPKSSDSDFGEPNHSIFPDTSYNEISMSLCGGLNESGPDEEAFLQRLVTYEDLVAEPKIIENPDLVVRLDGKYYNWKTACPMVMSVVVYQRALPQHVVDAVAANYMPHAAPDAPEGAKSVPPRGYTSWFSWPKKTAPKATSLNEVMTQENPFGEEPDPRRPDVEMRFPRETLSDIANAGEGEGSAKPAGTAEELAHNLEINIPERKMEHGEIIVVKPLATKEAAGSLALSVPTSTDVKEEEAYNGSNSSEDSDTSLENRVSAMPRDMNFYDHSDMYRKTLRLSSEQIAGLHLVEGANEVVFSVTTAYQGTTRCKCHIYKWRYDDKIVVSDIDGTITKSDVLGHILPIVGKDWAQSGVAQLFTKIQNNGYRLLYLSARAIGQARVTREYLRSIRQGDLSLPDGPLLLNPTSLISAFHREVIEKKPEEFKISCLRDIHALFPADSEPFYAGYGNKVNDVWAYRAVGIPIFRIFTINHRGELKHELTQTFQSSYSNMSYIVDQMFPPPPTVEPSGDFSSFVYWRDPLPELHIELPVKESPSKSTLKVAKRCLDDLYVPYHSLRSSIPTHKKSGWKNHNGQHNTEYQFYM